MLREHQRRAEEQSAGHHAEHQPVDRGFEAAVIEVDVEAAALDLLQDVAESAGEDLGQLLELGEDSPHLAHLPGRRKAAREQLALVGLHQLHQAEVGASSRPVPSSMISTLINIASDEGSTMW